MKHVIPILLSMSCLAPSAMAQTAASRATARSLAAEGAAALDKQDYSTAVERFQRADALVHAPTIALDLARALMGLGKYVEAQERLEQVLREGVQENAPWVWKRAVKDAQKMVEEVKTKVSWLTIQVVGPAQPSVTIDGVEVPSVALGVRRATNPGEHALRADAPGYLTKETNVSMPVGGEQTITLTLEVDPSTRAAPAPVAPVLAPVVVDRPKKKRSNALTYVALGVGGAGLAVGAVTGVIFLGKHSDLTSRCPDASNCAENDLISEYNKYGTISGVSLAVGVASSAAGLWLLFSNKSAEGAEAKPKTIAVQPYISPFRMGLTGAF